MSLKQLIEAYDKAVQARIIASGVLTKAHIAHNEANMEVDKIYKAIAQEIKDVPSNHVVRIGEMFFYVRGACSDSKRLDPFTPITLG